MGSDGTVAESDETTTVGSGCCIEDTLAKMMHEREHSPIGDSDPTANLASINELITVGANFELLSPAHPCSAASLQVAFVERRLSLLGRIPENYGLLRRPRVVPEGLLIRQIQLALQGHHADILLNVDAESNSFAPRLNQLTTVCTTPALINSLLQIVAETASQRVQITAQLDHLAANSGSQTLKAFACGVRLCVTQIDNQLGELEAELQHPGLGFSSVDVTENKRIPTLTAIACAMELVSTRTRRLWCVVNKVCGLSKQWEMDASKKSCAVIDWMLDHSRILHCSSLQKPRGKTSVEREGAKPLELLTTIVCETLVPLFRYLDRLLSPSASPSSLASIERQDFRFGNTTTNASSHSPDATILPALLRPYVSRIFTLSKAIRLLKEICPTDEGLSMHRVTLESRLISLKGQSRVDASPLELLSTCIQEHIDQPHFGAIRHRLVSAVLKGQGLLSLTHMVRSLFLFEHEHYMYGFVLLLYNSLDPSEAPSRLLDNLGHDVDRLLTTKLQGELSEFIEANSVTKISVTIHEQKRSLVGLDLLGAVQLRIDVPAPLNIVIDEHVIHVCQGVFAFLLKTKAVNYQLNRFQHNFRRKLLLYPDSSRTHSIHRLTIMLMEQLNFCHNLQNHLMRRMRVHSWEGFVQEVQAAQGIDELRMLHKRFLDDICTSCFLNPANLEKRTPIHGVIVEILKVSVKFKRTASGAFSEWPENPAALSSALAQLEAIHRSFSKAKSFLEKINSYANKEDEFLL